MSTVIQRDTVTAVSMAGAAHTLVIGAAAGSAQTRIGGRDLFVDPGGASATLTLPAEADFLGALRIVNTADAAEVLTIADDSAATVAILPRGGSCLVVCNGTSWEPIGWNQEYDIRVATGTITTAQVLALNATPQTLVAAPGAGFYLEFVQAHLFLDYNSAAYAGVAGGEDIALKYTDENGEEVARIEVTGFLDQTADQHRFLPHGSTLDAVVAYTPVANSPLVAHMLTGEITTGNSPLKYEVLYRVRRVAFA